MLQQASPLLQELAALYGGADQLQRAVVGPSEAVEPTVYSTAQDLMCLKESLQAEQQPDV
jgi:hypothetical protein